MKATPDSIGPFSENIYRRVMDIFHSPDATTIMETCAVTLGRLALLFPTQVAKDLKNIVKPLCIALRNLPDDSEKEDALRGLCEAIKHNPRDILPEFQAFCDVITSFYNPSPPLKELFNGILHAFKNQIDPQEWQRVIDSFPNRVKNALRQTYHL